MSTLAQLVANRRSGRADCPVKRHSSRLTVAVRVLDDGTLMLHDHAGCDARDILAAAGLNWSDLFPRNDPRRRRERQIQKRQAANLDARHQRKVTECCAILRNCDALIRSAGEALKFAPEHGADNSAAWDALTVAYKLRPVLEADFVWLNVRTK